MKYEKKILITVLAILLVCASAISIMRNNKSDNDKSSSNYSSQLTSSLESSSTESLTQENIEPATDQTVNNLVEIEDSFVSDIIPSLKLNFNDNWTAKVSKGFSKQPEIDATKVIFSRDNIEITTVITPAYAGGSCIVPAGYAKDTTDFENGFYKNIISFDGTELLEYSTVDDSICAKTNLIESNLVASQYPIYNQQNPNNEYVLFNLAIDGVIDDDNVVQPSDADSIAKIDELVSGFKV